MGKFGTRKIGSFFVSRIPDPTESSTTQTASPGRGLSTSIDEGNGQTLDAPLKHPGFLGFLKERCSGMVLGIVRMIRPGREDLQSEVRRYLEGIEVEDLVTGENLEWAIRVDYPAGHSGERLILKPKNYDAIFVGMRAALPEYLLKAQMCVAAVEERLKVYGLPQPLRKNMLLRIREILFQRGVDVDFVTLGEHGIVGSVRYLKILHTDRLSRAALFEAMHEVLECHQLTLSVFNQYLREYADMVEEVQNGQEGQEGRDGDRSTSAEKGGKVAGSGAASRALMGFDPMYC